MAGTLGITLGGMASARETRLNRELEEKALGVRETLARAENERELRKQIGQTANKFVEMAGQLSDRRGDPFADQVIGRFAKHIESLYSGAGMDPTPALGLLEGAYLSGQTPEEEAVSGARAEAKGAEALAAATGQTPEAVQRAKGLRPNVDLMEVYDPAAGSVRFATQEEVIASGGKLQPRTAGDPDDVEAVFDTQAGTLVFATTKEILANPQRYVPPPPKGADENRLDQTIRLMMEANPGMTRTQAVDLATGVSVLRSNPVSGAPGLVNKFTGEETILRTNLPQSASPEGVPEGQTLGEVAQTGEVAGAIPTMKEFFSAVTGQVGGEVAEKTIEARQTFRTAQNEIIRALSINPRFPVAEMNRIREEIEIRPAFWDSTPSLLSRMRSIKRSMETRLKNEESARDDQSLPAQDRQAAAVAAKDIKNFLALLGDLDAVKLPADDDVDALINKYTSP